MRKLKPLPKRIPRFSTYEEEANFWDTHDSSRLFEEGKPADVVFELEPRRPISIRMSRTLLHGIRISAAQRHIPYQTLIHMWLAEKLAETHRSKH